jgi:hypothetical protein
MKGESSGANSIDTKYVRHECAVAKIVTEHLDLCTSQWLKGSEVMVVGKPNFKYLHCAQPQKCGSEFTSEDSFTRLALSQVVNLSRYGQLEDSLDCLSRARLS